MADFRGGSKQAANELFELFYPELRRLAAVRMKGERSEHSWQPTVLVNELYLELIKIKGLKAVELEDQDEKAAFFGLAAHLMKRLLIHHARPLARRIQKITFDEIPEFGAVRSESMHDVEIALTRLGSVDPKLRTVAEMKVFEGLSVDQISEALQCAPRTVARRWSFAKHWLTRELGPQVWQQ